MHSTNILLVLSYISIFGKEEARRFLTIADGIRPDLDIHIIINFFKTIYSMAENRDMFIADVFETNVDMIFECIYNYATIKKQNG